MLLIFISHPIQYYVPWFAELHRQLEGELKVVFATRHGVDEAIDKEFGETFAWDMNLLDGYNHEFYSQSNMNLSPNGGFWGIRFPKVQAFIKKHRPDAIMVCGWLFAGYWEVAWAARKLNIPYIIRAESNLLNKGGAAKWWIKKQTVGRLCRGAATCLAIGQRNRELFQAYGVSYGRIRTALYSVDNHFFTTESIRLKSERYKLRNHYGLPPDAVIFIFMGKLIHKKHPDHLLKAWQGLSDSLKKRSAILYVGSGEMLQELNILSKNESRVFFTGFVNCKQLPETYVASDVLVLPSDEGETWGLVVNEAMASGLPVIISDRVGCGPDMVIESKTGYIFPFGDIGVLRTKMKEMINTAEKIEIMGEQARGHVRLASYKKAASQVVGILQSISARNI